MNWETFEKKFPDENSTKLGEKMSKFLYHKIIKKKPCIGLRNIL
jgi:hypothetical protein